MCGRYYVDDETAREIEKIVRELDKKLQIERAGDIRPSDAALVLSQREHHLTAEQMNWGFPGFQGKGLLINARAEGVLEKKTFRESVLHRVLDDQAVEFLLHKTPVLLNRKSDYEQMSLF